MNRARQNTTPQPGNMNGMNGRVGGANTNMGNNGGMNDANRNMNGGMNDANRNMNGRMGTGTDMNGLNGNDTNMNGLNGNGMNMNGRVGGASQRLSGSLEEQIRALAFVKTELELYLDTHPGCRIALDYYHRTLEELQRLTEEYQNTVGPLSAEGVMSNDEWTWVRQPWPWQRSGDYMQPRERER